MQPTFQEFRALAGHGNWIPVYREYLADTETPVSAYLKLRDHGPSYLLESAEGGRHWGRYSFIGCSPHLICRLEGDRLEIRWDSGEKSELSAEDPMKALRAVTRAFKAVSVPGLPPFQGGLVGFVDYDLARRWERIRTGAPGPSDGPGFLFMLARRLIVFDHFRHSVRAVAFAHLDGSRDPASVYEDACREVKETLALLRKPCHDEEKGATPCLSGLRSNFSREAFEEAVARAKNHIAAGDVIQVVLSQRFSSIFSGDDFTLYRNLRSINPSPYMFYLHFGQIRLLGASPEILARLRDGRIELRPIAGTRKRGLTPGEDRALERELLSDPKERAEHIMLVDLGRNDVGKVASPGTVKVPGLMEVERYSHVMHMVSRVEGVIAKDKDAFDLFMAAFPAGTVTGAPKARAMEIISDLEPEARGPYAGAVGYFALNGNMDFCITIRTMVLVEGKLSIQVGAGIVADSSPAMEYEETLKKAAALFAALGRKKKNDLDAG
ncbi:MAG: anthranilate synthase component I [Deltaproteobacteria bacterium]|nr:anthranilate synthase component I [Deltaproteobacteria bacterium]